MMWTFNLLLLAFLSVTNGVFFGCLFCSMLVARRTGAGVYCLGRWTLLYDREARTPWLGFACPVRIEDAENVEDPEASV